MQQQQKETKTRKSVWVSLDLGELEKKNCPPRFESYRLTVSETQQEERTAEPSPQRRQISGQRRMNNYAEHA